MEGLSVSDEQYCLKGTGDILRQRDPAGGAAVPSRRARWLLVIIGGVLLAFQAISIIVGARFGGCPWQEPYFMGGQAFWRDLLRLVYYLPAGIIGVVLVILALPKKQIVVAGCLAAACVMTVGAMAYTGTMEAEREQTAIAQAIASAKYVASSKEDTVHRPDCKYADWILSENIVTYDSLEDALKDGKHPCEECFKDALNGENSSGALSFSDWTALKEYGYIK
jgi:hypothetical protein